MLQKEFAIDMERVRVHEFSSGEWLAILLRSDGVQLFVAWQHGELTVYVDGEPGVYGLPVDVEQVFFDRLHFTV